jgi:hypothetical protein
MKYGSHTLSSSFLCLEFISGLLSVCAVCVAWRSRVCMCSLSLSLSLTLYKSLVVWGWGCVNIMLAHVCVVEWSFVCRPFVDVFNLFCCCMLYCVCVPSASTEQQPSRAICSSSTGQVKIYGDRNFIQEPGINCCSLCVGGGVGVVNIRGGKYSDSMVVDRPFI